MLDRLDEIEKRFDNIEQDLQDPAIVVNPDRLQKLGKQRAELEPVVEVIRNYKAALKQLEDANELLDDPELAEMAQEELDQAKAAGKC